ncbi:MAG: hypothetical protein PHY59_03780 [Methanobacterium sp.]|nr:hypothetical protein [Methanobacterium sp.]
MIEEIENIDNNFHRDLLKSRGEKLVNYEKISHKPAIDDIGPTEQIILTFEDTDEIDIENTYKVRVIANNMEVSICDSFNKPINIKSIIGKRLLDYGEIFFDDFNTSTGNMQRITLIFEEDYGINIDGYNLLIEKYN